MTSLAVEDLTQPAPPLNPARRLSPRERECLAWVQAGKSSRDIGGILGISHRVAERHIFRACQKLGVRTRLQAVLRALALGIIDARDCG